MNVPTARTVAALVRRTIGPGNASSTTRANGVVLVVVTGNADRTKDREALARTVAAAAIREGWDASRTGDVLTIAAGELPESVEETVEVEEAVEAPVDGEFRQTEHGLRYLTAAEVAAEEDEPGDPTINLGTRVAAALSGSIVPVASITARQPGQALVTVSDRVIGNPDRYESGSVINARAYSARGVLARAGFRETPTGGDGVFVEDSHLMSDDLLDACGTAPHGRGLLLIPDTASERITCPACLLLVEADVPPTDEERVTVRIRASELRPGDLVVDSLGEVQYAAFDVQQAGSSAPFVKVWTAIRDQERGLPPVVMMRAVRELLVLRPVSAEGRELLAALNRADDAPAFGSPAWALSLLPENRA